MDKFWENYITTRPVNSEGAFDAFKQMHQDPGSTIQGPRNMYQDGLLVGTPTDQVTQFDRRIYEMIFKY